MSSALATVDPFEEPQPTAAPAVEALHALEERAAALVNPESGLANDYLNIFNEVFLLIENLPVLLPEMLDELLAWRPKTYREYFETSPLPGAAETLKIYETLDPGFRGEFEEIVEGVASLSLACVKLIQLHRNADGEVDPDRVAEFCQTAAFTMRSALTRASDLVNHGHKPFTESPQETVERLLSQPIQLVEADGHSEDPETPAPELYAANDGHQVTEAAPSWAEPAAIGEGVEFACEATACSEVAAEPLAGAEPEPVAQAEAFVELPAGPAPCADAEITTPETLEATDSSVAEALHTPDVPPPSDPTPGPVELPVAEACVAAPITATPVPPAPEMPPAAPAPRAAATAPESVASTSASSERQASAATAQAPVVREENFFTVIVGGETLGLPVLLAQTIFQIPAVTPIPLGPSAILGLVNLRGRIVTAVSLRQRLGMADIPVDRSLAISVEHKGETFALVVDSVGDILTLNTSMRVAVPSHFDKSRSRFMSELYKVNGQLIPVLNPAAIFDFS